MSTFLLEYNRLCLEICYRYESAHVQRDRHFSLKKEEKFYLKGSQLISDTFGGLFLHIFQYP